MNRARLALVGLAVSLAACKGACSKPSADVDPADPTSSVGAARPADAAAIAPPRCAAITKKGTLGSIVDVGDAVVTPSGFAVGLVRKDNVLSIALVSADLANVTFADIGRARLEAPPPLPFVWGDSVYTAWIDSGDLRIGRVDGGKVALVADTVVDVVAHSAKQPPISDLPDVDVAVSGDHGIVIWDHETPKGSEVLSLPFDKNGFEMTDAGAAVVVSPSTADDEDPRLVPRVGGGYWALWIARKVEDDATDASEGPGEAPSLRWLEAAPLDARGVRVGDPVRLTPIDGHVAGLDLATHDGTTDVVIRDGAESTTDEGSSLLRVTIADKPSSSSILAASGVGRAVPVVVSGAGGALVVAPDPADATKIFPLGPAAALPSLEPQLKAARALVAKPAENGSEVLAVRLAGASGAADEAEIVLVPCGR